MFAFSLICGLILVGMFLNLTTLVQQGTWEVVKCLSLSMGNQNIRSVLKFSRSFIEFLSNKLLYLISVEGQW